MATKGINLKRIFNLQNILILIIILTVFYYIFYPKFFFQNYHCYKTQHRQIKEADLFYFNPNKQNEVLLVRQDYSNSYLNIYFYNIGTNELMQRDLHNSFIKNNYNRISSLYYDESENKVVIPIIKNKYELFLYSVEFSDRKMFSRKIYSFKNLYDSLIDTLLVKDNIKFYHPVLVSNNSYIEKYKDGYRFCLQRPVFESLFKSLSSFSVYKDLEGNVAYSKLAKMLNDELGDNAYYDNYDVYEIIRFFIRHNIYQEKYFKESNFKLLPTLNMEIVAQEDMNNDGSDELIIAIHFGRYLTTHLICYDVKAEKVLWDRNDYGDPNSFLFLDVNNDGFKEILFSTYAPCNEPPIDYDPTITKFNNQSYFVILNADGSIYNGKDYVFASIPGFYEYRFAKIENSDKLLFGMRSNYDSSEKPFIVYDYITQEIDTLNITYQNITSYEKKDGRIIFYDANDEGMRILEFDGSLSVIKDKKYDLGFPIFRWCSDNSITIYDESFYMSSNDPKRIVNKYMEVIYEFPNHIIEDIIHCYNNSIYFIERINRDYYLSEVKFIKSFKVNPFAIILFLCELLVLFAYLVLRETLRIPIKSATENYFVIHSFFGLLYVWRLTGAFSRFFRLPKRISFHRKIPYKYLNDISDKVQEFYTHSALFVKTKVFKFHTENELSIIQRISHDLKNQILVIKLQMDDYYARLRKKRAQEIGSMLETIKEISQVSQTLSNFSQINKLYREKTEINMLMDQILAELHSHKNIDCIKFRSDHDHLIIVDKKLLKIGLKNLITNALEAVTDDQQITILIKQVDHVLSIIIKNPTEISQEEFKKVKELGYTTMKTGSGLGIPIARSIIEKHDGKFQILLKDNYFIVEIFLPYNT